MHTGIQAEKDTDGEPTGPQRRGHRRGEGRLRKRMGGVETKAGNVLHLLPLFLLLAELSQLQLCVNSQNGNLEGNSRVAAAAELKWAQLCPCHTSVNDQRSPRPHSYPTTQSCQQPDLLHDPGF